MVFVKGVNVVGGYSLRARIYAGLKIEFLSPGTVAKFIIKMFIVTTIAQQSSISPELLLKHAPQPIVSTSARLE
ncbi:MAG TPA: hypothetical protein VIL78_04945 [Hanamia sp.]